MNIALKYLTGLAIIFVLLSNSIDPPNGRTGAPGDGVCSSCHQGNNFDGNVEIGGLPDEVESGTTYSLSVTVNNTDGNAIRAGFQMVAIFNDDFTNAGELMGNSQDEGVSIAGGRRYIEHRGAKNFQDSVAQWIFDWEAPIVDEDQEVVMFAAGNITNGSGSSGDAVKLTDGVTIVKPAPKVAVEVMIEESPILCEGGLGDLLAMATGGTEVFTYMWSNGVNTIENNDLPAGTYSVTVTDSDGDTAEAAIDLEQPSAIEINLTVMDESGESVGDGSIQSEVAGGTPPYTFEWSNGASTAAIDSLSEGTYLLTVTDANGCQDTIQADVGTTACAFEINLDFTQITCSGSSDGEAIIDPTGFVQPLEFMWSNGDNSFIAIAGLEEGSYAVTVADGSGCTIIESFEIIDPDPLELDVFLDFPDCTMPSENNMTATVSGGTSPYSYLWSDGSTSMELSNVAEGTYAVTVTDANGCSISLNEIMATFEDLEGPRITFTDSVSLFVDENGVLDLSPLNIETTDNCGVASFEISGNTSCEDLGPRTISYQATDINGNVTSQDIYIISVIDTIAPTASCVDDITLNGCDTIFYVAPSFADNCAIDSIELAEGLPPGSVFPKDSTKVTYNVYDAAGNFACCSFWVVVINDLEFVIDEVMDATPDKGGAISISASGGTGNLSFEWILNDTMVVSNFEDVTNLAVGSYKVRITDEEGCTLLSDAILIELGSFSKSDFLTETKLSPNPVLGFLKVDYKGALGSYTIVDANGRLIKRTKVNRSDADLIIDTSDFMTGLYFLKLDFQKGSKSLKFLKL